MNRLEIREPVTSASARPNWGAWCSCALISIFLVSSVVVHILQPAFNPFEVALSVYMNGSLGWLLRMGLICLGVGSMLAGLSVCAPASQRSSRRRSVILLSLWAAGCIAGGVFPPDAYGQWKRRPSFAGLAHSVAAMVAFSSFPLAALSLSQPSTPGRAALRRLAMICTVLTVMLFLCLAPAVLHRPPFALGLAERLTLAGYVGWLLLALRVRGGISEIDFSEEENHDRNPV